MRVVSGVDVVGEVFASGEPFRGAKYPCCGGVRAPSVPVTAEVRAEALARGLPPAPESRSAAKGSPKDARGRLLCGDPEAGLQGPSAWASPTEVSLSRLALRGTLAVAALGVTSGENHPRGSFACGCDLISFFLFVPLLFKLRWQNVPNKKPHLFA